MIQLLTFTGVDEHTSFPKLLDLAHLYPAVEFAVLVGSPTGTGTKPRFPRLAVAHRLRGLGVDHSLNTSIHLCGRFAKEALDPRGPDPAVLDLCEGFGRVQVNLAGRAFQKGRLNRTVAAISRFANEVGCGSVIVQHRGRWEDVPLRHPRVEYLFDRSGGRGQTAFDHWPAPIGQPPRVGYSGTRQKDDVCDDGIDGVAVGYRTPADALNTLCGEMLADQLREDVRQASAGQWQGSANRVLRGFLEELPSRPECRRD